MTDVPPRDPSAWPTPEQLLAEFDALSYEQRLQRAAELIESAVVASDCVGHWHRQRLGKDSLTNWTVPVHVVCPDCAKPVQVRLVLRPDGNLVHLALPEDDFTQAFAAHAMAAPEQHPTLVVRT
jgi:hypothetical protein